MDDAKTPAAVEPQKPAADKGGLVHPAADATPKATAKPKPKGKRARPRND